MPIGAARAGTGGERRGRRRRCREGAQTSLGFRAALAREAEGVVDDRRDRGARGFASVGSLVPSCSVFDETTQQPTSLSSSFHVVERAGARAKAALAASRASTDAVVSVVNAIDLILISARSEARAAAIVISRERARVRELSEEIMREQRRSAKAEGAARALRCELKCARWCARRESEEGEHPDASSPAHEQCVSYESAMSVGESQGAAIETDIEVDVDAKVCLNDAHVDDDGAATAASDSDTRRDDSMQGRDRRVSISGDDDDGIHVFCDAAWDMDVSAAHGHVTAVALELARATRDGDYSTLDVRHTLCEVLHRLHGSYTLSEAHRRTFLDALARHQTSSPWAHVFVRLYQSDATSVTFFALIMRYCERALVEDVPDASPSLPIDVALEALTSTLRCLGLDAALVASGVDGVRRSATHRDGVSTVQLAMVVDYGFDVVSHAREAVRKACEAAFMRRHPAKKVLAHHGALATLLADVSQSCQSGALDLNASTERTAMNIVRQCATGATCEYVTCERFVDMATSALFVPRVDRAENEPSPTTAPSSSLSLKTSLALIAYAWNIAKPVIDRWLAKWLVHAARPSPPATSASSTARAPLPVAQSIDTSKRRIVRAHIDRLRKLRHTTDYAIQAARAFARARAASAVADVARAAESYARCACALESAVVAHRRSLGVADARVRWHATR